MKKNNFPEATSFPFPVYPPSVVPEQPHAAAMFEREFKELGGRLSVVPGEAQTLSPEWFRRRFWDYLTKLRVSELYGAAVKDAYFDLIDSSAMNAAVIPTDDRALIGLCRGAVDNLTTFFNVLLSHPEVFPAVGDAVSQSKWFEDLSAWDWNFSVALAWETFRSQHRVEPKLATGARAHFAGHLSMFALDFAFFHELGHWCWGHDRFAAALRAELGTMDELTERNLPPIVSQFLELNADSFAVIFMTNEWFQMELGPTSIFPSPLEALRVWATAMAFTFMLFGQERKIQIVKPVGMHPHPVMLKSSYPHPAIRLYNAGHAATNIARLFSANAVSLMTQAWAEGTAAAAEVCWKLKVPSSIWFVDPETTERTYQAMCMNFMPFQSGFEQYSRLTIS